MPRRLEQPIRGIAFSSHENRSLTRPRHICGMTLYAADGSSFSCEIVKSASGGFDASFRIERRVDGQPCSESGMLHVLSRDIALLWLRVEAVVRGFDGRGVK